MSLCRLPSVAAALFLSLLLPAAVPAVIAAVAPAGEIRGRVLVDGKPAPGVAGPRMPVRMNRPLQRAVLAVELRGVDPEAARQVQQGEVVGGKIDHDVAAAGFAGEAGEDGRPVREVSCVRRRPPARGRGRIRR